MSIDDLKKMTLVQLRDLATAHAVTGATKFKKEELIARLVAKLAAPAPVGALRPSSSSSSTVSAPAAARARHAPEPGLPIPDRYGRNRLVLMVQDPWHVFAYWEVAPESLTRDQACATVLLVYTPHGNESREVDLIGGNYYFTVAPGTTLHAELALRDPQGRLTVLARSNELTTPAAGPSARHDETWMAVDETFSELLDRAGLPGASPSSSERLSSADLARRTVVWNLVTVDHRSLSSSALPLGLSSRSLSSRDLSKRSP